MRVEESSRERTRHGWVWLYAETVINGNITVCVCGSVKKKAHRESADELLCT